MSNEFEQLKNLAENKLKESFNIINDSEVSGYVSGTVYETDKLVISTATKEKIGISGKTYFVNAFDISVKNNDKKISVMSWVRNNFDQEPTYNVQMSHAEDVISTMELWSDIEKVISELASQTKNKARIMTLLTSLK